MRVLMVAQPTEAGVANCVLDWSAGLAGRGEQVAVACPHGGHLPTAVAAAGLEVHPWPAVREPHRGVPREARALAAIVRQWRPDVVHLHGSKAGLTGRLVLRGRVPTAFSPHAWSHQALTGSAARAAQAWERVAARWTTGWICVSEAERAAGRAIGLVGPMHVAVNGVDTERLRPLGSGARAALRRRLGIEPHEQLAVCVARLARQKGVDVLLAAWQGAAAPDRRLVVVGDGPEATRLRAQQVAGVRFTGPVDRAAAIAWMQAADVVVMPSRWEGMALVPMESLAVGTPVVATDVAGAGEVLEEACGSVVPVEDPVALARAVDLWLAPGAREQAHRLARARAEAAFDVRRTVADLARALGSVAGGDGGRRPAPASAP